MRLRQEDWKFEASLGNSVRPCFRKGLGCSSVAECLASMCRALSSNLHTTKGGGENNAEGEYCIKTECPEENCRQEVKLSGRHLPIVYKAWV